ncbi:unnamed protein product [Protopolystoma xenopodis]|uniref:Uncharacterized protein n=1 Tax=Protopolystoma xenopodis TaxID=117903 RepID=A0A448WQF8_9PLAT|nr:unnamed protein product [Protopolystoma xenopodis]
MKKAHPYPRLLDISFLPSSGMLNALAPPVLTSSILDGRFSCRTTGSLPKRPEPVNPFDSLRSPPRWPELKRPRTHMRETSVSAQLLFASSPSSILPASTSGVLDDQSGVEMKPDHAQDNCPASLETEADVTRQLAGWNSDACMYSEPDLTKTFNETNCPGSAGTELIVQHVSRPQLHPYSFVSAIRAKCPLPSSAHLRVGAG